MTHEEGGFGAHPATLSRTANGHTVDEAGDELFPGGVGQLGSSQHLVGGGTERPVTAFTEVTLSGFGDSFLTESVTSTVGAFLGVVVWVGVLSRASSWLMSSWRSWSVTPLSFSCTWLRMSVVFMVLS